MTKFDFYMFKESLFAHNQVSILFNSLFISNSNTERLLCL